MISKLVETVKQTAQQHSGKFDRYQLTNILTGQQVVQSPYIGALKEYTDDEILSTIQALIKDSILIVQKVDNKSIVFFNEDSNKPQTQDYVDTLLLEELKTWRAQKAQELKTPLYKVANNAALQDIAKHKPTTHQELLVLKGMGPGIVRKYGDDLLHLAQTKQETIIEDDTEKLTYTTLDIHKKLDHQQQVAAGAHAEQIACIAGAGSGKTSVLVGRIQYYIEALQVRPSKILAITFTRKAAQELKDRIQLEEQTITAATFNSFCEAILKEHTTSTCIDGFAKKNLMYKATSSIPQEKMQEAFELANITRETHVVDDFVNTCIQVYEYTASEDLTFEQLVQKHPKQKVLIELAQQAIYEYIKLKHLNNLHDFTDQLVKVIQLLEQPEIKQELQERYTHILVDEYQDINALQHKLLEKLVSKHLFVVGDPRQSIYGFRGSRPDILTNIKEYMPNMKIVQLVNNYRSAAKIVELANTVCKPLHVALPQEATKQEKATIIVKEYNNPEEEAIHIAQQIKLLHVREQIRYKDMFVLARTNKQLDLLKSVFRQCDVDCVTTKDQHFLQPLPHQVVLSTVHGVKGLEAQVVFVTGLSQGVFPIYSTPHMLTNQGADEELRLFYVATTRAKEQLHLSWYNHNGKNKCQKGSFLNEEIYSFIVRT